MPYIIDDSTPNGGVRYDEQGAYATMAEAWDALNELYPMDDEEGGECGFCQTFDCDGDCEVEDDYDFTSYDYPEYDQQTAFYESTGRMQFPNEY